MVKIIFLCECRVQSDLFILILMKGEDGTMNSCSLILIVSSIPYSGSGTVFNEIWSFL